MIKLMLISKEIKIFLIFVYIFWGIVCIFISIHIAEIKKKWLDMKLVKEKKFIL